ncbi:MAG: PAS domain-containing protein, partial [Ginsengibacter sp.]
MKNEKDLFAIFKVSPNPNIVLAPDAPKFTIVAVNDAYLEIFKTSGQDWVGKGFFDAFACNPYHQRAAWLKTVEKAIETKMAQNIGTHKYDGSGKIDTDAKARYFNTLITPVIGIKNEIKFLLSTTTDITEVMLLQESKDLAIETLKKNEKSLRETQRIARVGSWELDLVNDVSIWSDELGDIFEIEPGSDPG